MIFSHSFNLCVFLEVDGDIKRSRKGRYKAGGPVLNIVFSNGIRAGDLDGTLNNVISIWLLHFIYDVIFRNQSFVQPITSDCLRLAIEILLVW